MISFAGSDIDMVNSGTISVVAGPRSGSGMDYTFNASFTGYESGSVNMDNSGNIAVSDAMLVTGQEDGIGLTLASGGNARTPPRAKISIFIWLLQTPSAPPIAAARTPKPTRYEPLGQPPRSPFPKCGPAEKTIASCGLA